VFLVIPFAIGESLVGLSNKPAGLQLYEEPPFTVNLASDPIQIIVSSLALIIGCGTTSIVALSVYVHPLLIPET